MASSGRTKQRINLSIDPEIYARMRKFLIEDRGLTISGFTEFLYALTLQLEEMGFDVIDQKARDRLSKRGVADPSDTQLFSETMQMLSGFMTVWVKAYAKGADLNRSGSGAGPKPKNQSEKSEAQEQDSNTEAVPQ